MTTDTQSHPCSSTVSAGAQTAPTGSGPGRLDLSLLNGHTPGPWRVYDDTDEIGSVSTADGSLQVAQAQATKHVRNKEDLNERIANTRLIAASPTLLAELREARATIERLESAIRWALGYDEGEPHFGDGEQAEKRYGWRTELRRRAAIPVSPPTSQPADGDGGASTLPKLK